MKGQSGLFLVLAMFTLSVISCAPHGRQYPLTDTRRANATGVTDDGLNQLRFDIEQLMLQQQGAIQAAANAAAQELADLVQQATQAARQATEAASAAQSVAAQAQEEAAIQAATEAAVRKATQAARQATEAVRQATEAASAAQSVAAQAQEEAAIQAIQAAAEALEVVAQEATQATETAAAAAATSGVETNDDIETADVSTPQGDEDTAEASPPTPAEIIEFNFPSSEDMQLLEWQWAGPLEDGRDNVILNLGADKTYDSEDQVTQGDFIIWAAKEDLNSGDNATTNDRIRVLKIRKGDANNNDITGSTYLVDSAFIAAIKNTLDNAEGNELPDEHVLSRYEANFALNFGEVEVTAVNYMANNDNALSCGAVERNDEDETPEPMSSCGQDEEDETKTYYTAYVTRSQMDWLQGEVRDWKWDSVGYMNVRVAVNVNGSHAHDIEFAFSQAPREAFNDSADLTPDALDIALADFEPHNFAFGNDGFESSLTRKVFRDNGFELGFIYETRNDSADEEDDIAVEFSLGRFMAYRPGTTSAAYRKAYAAISSSSFNRNAEVWFSEFENIPSELVKQSLPTWKATLLWNNNELGLSQSDVEQLSDREVYVLGKWAYFNLN